MQPYAPEDLRELAVRLARACQTAGLRAESCGAQVLVRGATRHLDERVICLPDSRGRLRWHWSWGAPICHPCDPDRPLGVEDVENLVRSIMKVVAGPARETR